jgi:hypothetical protein
MRRFALLGLVLMPLMSARAQIKGSVIGGYVSAKVSESFQGATVTLASRAGFAAGLGLTRDIAHDIAFAPELLYVQKGFDQTSGTGASAEEFKFKLSYIEVPILFRASFAGGSARPFITAGPAIAFKISCSGEASTGGSSVSQDCNVNGGPNLNSMDFGVIVGAGIGYRNLTFSARYDAGLANLEKNAPAGESLKNRAWIFLVSLAVK